MLTPPPAQAGSGILPEAYFRSLGVKITILPSSPLYGLKTFWENLQLLIAARNPQLRSRLLTKYCSQRLDEIYTLITQDSKTADQTSLFKLLQRYQNQYRTLQLIIGQINVGQDQLGILYQNHLKKRAFLKQISQTQKKLLGSFWVNEISAALSTAQPAKSLHKSKTPANVLGAFNHQGLELYPITKNKSPIPHTLMTP